MSIFRCTAQSCTNQTHPNPFVCKLATSQYTAACRSILEAAEASSDADILPGTRDLSVNFSFPREYLGEFFKKPCDEEQSIFLLKNKNFFTAGEDNLVLRGVNLYGEKQWALIVDRFLSDRSINVVSQRYSKLCVMLYKANGVSIDSRGNLDQPPHLDSVDDIDDRKVALIPKVSPPAILNVHRWSLEEDLTLLRAVPLMGPMWAELGARLIPHRDRGHLRKRYQVLERRVKATVCRSLKNAIAIPKPAAKPTRPPQQEKHNNPPRVAQGETGTKQSPVKLRSQYPQQKVWSETKARASSSTYHAEKPKQMSSVHEPYYPPAEKSRIFSTGTDAGTSRAAFEKLASESTMGWSQMSRIREVIENGDESDIVDALSSKPKSLDTNPPMESSQSASNSVGGIMASVLERANGGHTVNNCVDKKMNSQSFALKTNRRSAAPANESPQHDVEQSSDPGFDVTNTTDGDSMLDLNGMTMNMGELSWGDVRGGRR